MSHESYFIIWVEGFSARHGEKIKSFKDDRIEYTLKLTKAMRILQKDIPAMKEELRRRGIAGWVIDSDNTFIKTSYAPKGTLFKFT